MEARKIDRRVDDLARALAAKAGMAWDQLNHYPGYYRTYWREEAEVRLKTGKSLP